MGNGWHLTAGYHYLHAVRLLSSNTVNGIPDGFLSDGRQKFQPADPGFGFALYATPSGWSVYNVWRRRHQSGKSNLRKSHVCRCRKADSAFNEVEVLAAC
jgi:hypothetical protein